MKFPSLTIAEEIRQSLLAMEGRIPTLLSIEVGVDVTRSGRSWDLALLTRFDDQDALEDYAAHPVHLEVVSMIREHATDVAAVDYLT